MIKLDGSDRKILAALQEDARLTNGELADRIGLSASQCSRRRMALEQSGAIAGYHARLDREKTGFNITCFVQVTLATHNAGNSKRISQLFLDLPQVLEAHAMTGEMDYYLKVVTQDLKSLSAFINDKLLAHEAVQNVKTSVALDTIKESGTVPV
jgi:DNA-binding Lrp family transcriptional regulator